MTGFGKFRLIPISQNIFTNLFDGPETVKQRRSLTQKTPPTKNGSPASPVFDFSGNQQPLSRKSRT
jgi:hypothetical protein